MASQRNTSEAQVLTTFPKYFRIIGHLFDQVHESLESSPHSGNAKSNFPTAAKCSNQLSLPRYSDKETLKKFLLLAIQDEMVPPKSRCCRHTNWLCPKGRAGGSAPTIKVTIEVIGCPHLFVVDRLMCFDS